MLLRGDKMKHIKIYEKINSNIADDNKKGDLVFEEIKQAVQQKEDVIIDFTGIDVLNTAFLNNAIGQIYSIEYISRKDSKISITNFPLELQDLLEETINIAKDKYSV